MRAAKFTCPYCDKKSAEGFTLKDMDGKRVGIYCSKDCAEGDAWGPRFKSFSIRKATPAEVADFAQ